MRVVAGNLPMRVVARHLGVELYGQLAYALSFITLFFIIPDIGLSNLFARDVAQDKNNSISYISHSLIMKTLASVFLFAVIYVLMMLFDFGTKVETLFVIFTLYIILDSFYIFLTRVFFAYEQFIYLGLASLVRYGVYLGLILYGLFNQASIYYVANSYAISAFIAVVFLFILEKLKNKQKK